MAAYYNEIDPFAAVWLRELIKAGLVADGEVDERSIADVRPDDVRGFTQCHFFAGIGGWSLALRLAGWSDDRAVWTGSCPCQPFSSAGAQAGGDDSRDLWPVWLQLVKECRPVVVFGEQVEAAIGHGWLDRLCDDLEAEDYAVGACGLPAASVGAFHIRQRLWFVADADDARPQGRLGSFVSERTDQRVAWQGGAFGRLADAPRRDQRRHGREPRIASGARGGEARAPHGHTARGSSAVDELAHADEWGCEEPNLHIRPARQDEAAAVERGTGFWSAVDWIPCADGKARPVEPGTFPLAARLPGDVGRLRGYGNAIVPQVAQVFIEAYMNVAAVD